MASKSRRKKKHSLQSKKIKRRVIPTITTIEQQPVTQTYKPAVPPVQEPAPAIARYPHVAADLRRIGILAGILLAALGVLSFVLS